MELYDLVASPNESDDLAAVDTRAVGQLRGLLDDWLEEVGARMPQSKN